MKSFFQTFFASCLGVFGAMVLCVLILVGIGMSSLAKQTSISDNSILKLSLEETIPEKSDNVEVDPASILSSPTEAIGLTRILKLIDAASKDDKIKGILLENNYVSIGQSSVLSLIEGLKKFKESGKFIYSYADSHSQASYMLCSVADSMFLNPRGGVDLKGFGASIPFFKGMLDKVGVEMNIFYAGNFKSATEPFRLSEMSEYNRLQTRSFLEDIKSIMIEQITKNRKLSSEKLASVMAGLEGRTAEKSLENGLVDGLMYKDELEDFLKKKMGIAVDKKLKFITLSKYNALADIDVSTSKDKIAVVYAEGEILYGSDDAGAVTDKKYIKMLSKIRQDKNIKAVVLRVNSPGGSAFTSDVIWHEIERIKAAGKPVIASFGDYAASGGYYIAAGADKIIAQPNTLTGSIGAFMMFPNATKLLNDKLGVRLDTVKTDEFAAGFSPMLNLSEKEKALLQETTLEIYDLFIDRVSKGRKLSVDSTKIIAQGRIWSGRNALNIGLVDQLGSLDDAITLAGKKAGLDDYKVTEYPIIEEDFMSTIIKEVSRGKDDDVATRFFTTKDERKLLQQYQQLRNIVRLKEPQARVPYIFDFN